MLEQADFLFEKHGCKHPVHVASVLKTTYIVLKRDLNMMRMMTVMMMMCWPASSCFKQTVSMLEACLGMLETC